MWQQLSYSKLLCYNSYYPNTLIFIIGTVEKTTGHSKLHRQLRAVPPNLTSYSDVKITKSSQAYVLDFLQCCMEISANAIHLEKYMNIFKFSVLHADTPHSFIIISMEHIWTYFYSCGEDLFKIYSLFIFPSQTKNTICFLLLPPVWVIQACYVHLVTSICLKPLE